MRGKAHYCWSVSTGHAATDRGKWIIRDSCFWLGRPYKKKSCQNSLTELGRARPGDVTTALLQYDALSCDGSFRAFRKARSVFFFQSQASALETKTCNYGIPPYYTRSTRWGSWLRHCTTSRKVAGSIPYGVIGIFPWHNPSGRTTALGSTQLLTEMSTRNISWA